jgi:hypothetical protein
MPLDADHVSQDKPAPNEKSNDQADQPNPHMPITFGMLAPPPSKTHYEITCKPEKSKLDKLKDVAEIVGICLLAIYTFYTIKMYHANRTAADAAKSAADTAASQLELEQRPWVDTTIAIDGPVTWNVNGMNVAVKITAMNTGHSPALGVFSSPLLLIGARGGMNASTFRSQACKDAEGGTIRLGPALFPARSIEGQYSFRVSNDDIEQGKAEREFPGSKFGNVILGPSMVICTAYRPEFNKTSVYHTAVIVDLFKIDSKGNMLGMFTIGEDVDAAHLKLRFSAIDPISAD